MKLRCLFGMRKEAYEGEYGPELLVAVDEFTDDENPTFFDEHSTLCTANKDREWAGFAFVEIAVDGEKIRRRCIPGPLQMPGKVLPPPEPEGKP